MKKGWKYRVTCGLLAMMMAGVEPTMAYAEQDNGTEAGESSPQEDNMNGNPEVAAEGENPPEENPSENAADSAEGEGALTMDEQIDAYFDGAVFVGDSVMVGYSNYAMRRGGPCLGKMKFLAAVSFSAFNALRPITAKSTHPLYQGQKRYIWDSLAMMQAKRVFLCFGLNDIDMGPLEKTGERYAQVIENIKAACPDVEIHIISMTYMRSARAKGRLNNPSIMQFNEMMRQMALNNGWGYVDIANPLADGSGQLASQYCSDNYVHQTNAAYDVWTQVLREYAWSQIQGTSAYPVGGQKAPEDENAAAETPEDENAETSESAELAETAEPSETTESSETAGSRVIKLKEERDQGGPGMVRESEESAEAAGVE